MSDQITKHLTRLSMDLYKAAKERDAARADADGLRAKIEAHNAKLKLLCRGRCPTSPAVFKKCGDCPRRYIIELPERAKG